MNIRSHQKKALAKLQKNEIPDVIELQISDHRPLVHDTVLFWNVMKQGNKLYHHDTKAHVGYDNGFGWEESVEDYQSRLRMIAWVIAVIVRSTSGIEMIGICEGPIKAIDIQLFLDTLKQFRWMTEFTKMSYTQCNKNQWGIRLLAREAYKVQPVKVNLNKITLDVKSADPLKKLTDRFQLWRVSKEKNTKFIALSHFPLSKSETAINSKQFSEATVYYTQIVNYFLRAFADQLFTFAGDFNFNPYLLNEKNKRYLDFVPVNNSLMCQYDSSSKTISGYTVTVDGILLSDKSKQKFYSQLTEVGLFGKLMLENKLSKLYEENQLLQFGSQGKDFKS